MVFVGDAVKNDAQLRGMIQAAGLPVRGSYRKGEVCLILGIGSTTFWRLVSRYEPDEDGRPVRPDSLATIQLSQNRVSFTELVDFLARNDGYTKQHALDPKQMNLFEVA